MRLTQAMSQVIRLLLRTDLKCNSSTPTSPPNSVKQKREDRGENYACCSPVPPIHIDLVLAILNRRCTCRSAPSSLCHCRRHLTPGKPTFVRTSCQGLTPKPDERVRHYRKTRNVHRADEGTWSLKSKRSALRSTFWSKKYNCCV